MKGIKWKSTRHCYGLYLVAFVLLSAIFGYLGIKNSYAIADAFVPVVERNVSQITYLTKYNDEAASNEQTWTATDTNIFRKAFGPTTNVTSDKIQRFYLRKFKLNNSIPFNKDVKYYISQLISIKVLGPNSYAGVNCPGADSGTTRNIILDCKITSLGLNQNNQYNTLQQAGIASVTPTKEYIYQVELYGTYNLDNISEENLPVYVNELNFAGNYISWYSKDNYINAAEITIQTTRFNIGYEYSEALEIAEQQRQQDQEDRNNVSSTSDQAEGDGDSATNDAQGQTQSALSVVTSFVGAITNMHQTNCKIPNININGMQLKDLDFCQTPVPPQLSALVGLGMVFIIVPLAISLVKRMLSLYNEILGGK